MPSHPHCHWRSVKDWQYYGLDMSTTSDEATKMLDASLTQLVARYDDPSIGGLTNSMNKMTAADPNFILGHVLKCGTDAMRGKTVYNDASYANDISHLEKLIETSKVNTWEQQHGSAIQQFAHGNMFEALSIWEDILIDKPQDILALKLSHDIFGFTGYGTKTHDICSRAITYWKPDMPLYGDVLSMYAFGLEETKSYEEATKIATKALEINRHDGWATHCLAHCHEMKGKYEDGIKFMLDTEQNWDDSSLSCHNFWHLALFYLEKGDFESAIGLLDSKILPDMHEGHSINSMGDAASLAFRLESEGYNVGARWRDCYHIGQEHADDRVWVYSDINTLFTCIWGDKSDDTERLIDNVKDFINNGEGDNRQIYQDVGLSVLEAVQAFGDQKYDTAVDLMMSVKDHVYKIGGSAAQRDLLNMFTIHAGLRAKKTQHKKYAEKLIMERKHEKGNTPLVERLTQMAVIKH